MAVNFYARGVAPTSDTLQDIASKHTTPENQSQGAHRDVGPLQADIPA